MTRKYTDLEVRMKDYESRETEKRLIPTLPVCVRLDGKSFHTFTRGLERPFDTNFHALMVSTTKYLAEETNALIGYTQSDEITLILYSDSYDSQIFFDGRVFKITSILASMASAYFNNHLVQYLPSKANYLYSLPVFDCRCWNVPSKEEACNVLLWRERDATRNSIQMAAQSVYSHNELLNKNTKVLQEMLFQKGINWNDYMNWEKRGTYIQRVVESRSFTASEIMGLPLKHKARTDPNLKVERKSFKIVVLPPFEKIVNKVATVFGGDTARTQEDQEKLQKQHEHEWAMDSDGMDDGG